uniref:Uncharacterized protein n=1 Tax=Ananas comosus var. bracteatus TaxID=296719 RepID=A0A6V7P546_ANACO|nr:unnamed protein product [Ananas comosus var. bracteatus]
MDALFVVFHSFLELHLYILQNEKEDVGSCLRFNKAVGNYKERPKMENCGSLAATSSHSKVVLVYFGKIKYIKITKSALETSPREQIVRNLHWSKTALGDRSLAGRDRSHQLVLRGLLEATGPWQSFDYLPLCSFAHACEGRSLQAGTPEMAIAIHIRRAGLGAEVDCRGPGSFLGWDVDYHGAIRLGTGQTAFGWVSGP